jgi:hypothetical protein
MKLARTVSLSAVAALIAMTSMTTSAAMAESTQLCTNETGTCVEPMEIHWVSVGHAKILSSLANLECDMSLSGTVTLGLVTGGPVVIAPAVLSYSNCLNGASVTVIKQGTIKILNEGNELGTVTGSGFKILQEASTLHCVYSFESLKGHLLGPLKTGTNHDHVSYTEVEMHKVEGFFCPATTQLDLLFEDSNTSCEGPSAIWART